MVVMGRRLAGELLRLEFGHGGKATWDRSGRGIA